MKFVDTGLAGAYVLDVEPLNDERGFFARTWCAREAEERGLNPRVAQCSISVNRVRGTLRGMHFQAAPYHEAKLVRCTQGAIYDVIVDLRESSPTFLQSFGVELTAANRKLMYIPEGFAHGFLTLVDDTEVWYQMSEFYVPGAGRGLRWNDPALGIVWPGEVCVISERDQSYPDFQRGMLASLPVPT